MMAPDLPAVRKIERKELITLFAALAPGDEVTFDEIRVSIGLDPARSGDRNLIWAVREHCRDVLEMNISAVPGRGYRRATDEETVGPLVERRRNKIYRQAQRGVAETVAVQDFGALSHQNQLRLLAHQAVFGAVALASHEKTAARVGNDIAQRGVLKSSPGDVMRMVAAIKQ